MVLTRGEDDEKPVTIDVRTDFVDLKLSKEFVSFSAKKNFSTSRKRFSTYRYRMWPISGDARSWHRAMTRIGRKISGLDRSNRVIVPLKTSHWFDEPTIDAETTKLRVEGDEVISMTDDVYYITESNVHVYGRFVVTNYSMLFAYFDDLNVSKHRKSHDFFYVRLFVFCVFLQQNH